MPMSRHKRTWHPEFLRYMKFIVNHPNYKDLPNKFKENGKIRWVSPSDKERAAWWDKKIVELGLHSRAEVARAIFPKELHGMHPCQICGRKMSIFYIYPNKNTAIRIKAVTGILVEPYSVDINELFDMLRKKFGNGVYDKLNKIFDISDKITNNKDSYLRYIEENRNQKLSPGVMSNPPDRLDGFHTYNACHRSKEDTGRYKANLARYSQDRRAYENWAEGDWNLSNRLMGEFKRYDKEVVCPVCGRKARMSADHIGPISLGFTHGPRFNPMCKSCNSKKNNRMTLEDVKTLIAEEGRGRKVISWHSKYVWDKLKTQVKSNNDALKLSKVMRWHLNNILYVFSIINNAGYGMFLTRFLHPEYSFVDYRFDGFDPLHLEKLRIISKPLDSKNKRKNADRYIRISLESLRDYQNKNNRNVKHFENEDINIGINELLEMLARKEQEKAYDKLYEIVRQLSVEAIKKYSAS